MDDADVEASFSHLAMDGNMATLTQNQALSALVFLYRDVLDVDLAWLSEAVRVKRRARLPVALTQREVPLVLDRLSGVGVLMARLVCG